MTAVLNWIKAEWRDPSTHVWLAAEGGVLTAWSNGTMTDHQALAAAIAAAIAIIIPTGAKP